MTLNLLAFLLAFVLTGLALDAALYWRFRNMLEAFRIVPDGLDYRHYAFPRLIFVASSALVVACGSYARPTDTILIIAGSVAFLVFSSYPHILIYRRSRRIE